MNHHHHPARSSLSHHSYPFPTPYATHSAYVEAVHKLPKLGSVDSIDRTAADTDS